MPGPVLAVTGGPILVLGDSLSAAHGFDLAQGWVQGLRERLASHDEDREVINASISGETTRGGLARLPELLARHRPAIVILELGGNDGLRGTPLAAMRANLGRLVELAQAANAQVLLLGMRLPPNYGPVYTKKFHNVYADLARDYELAWLPFFLAGVATRPAWMQTDGIHPTAAAQPHLLENVWPVLKPILQ